MMNLFGGMIWLCLAIIMAPSVTAADRELAQRIIDSRDDAYVDARNAALALDDAAFAQLIEELRREERGGDGRFASHVLLTYKRFPESVEAFEAAIAESLANPRHTAAGFVIYRGPRVSNDMNGINELRLEYAIWRPALPSGVSSGMAGKVWPSEGQCHLIDGIMMYFRNDQSGMPPRDAVGALARLSEYCSASIISDAFLEIYRTYRHTHPDAGTGASPIAAHLAHISAPEALAVARQMLAEEIAFLEARGVHPWEEDLVGDLNAAHERVRVAMRSRRENPEEYEAAIAARDIASQRARDRFVWETLQETIATLEAKLAERAEQGDPDDDQQP